MKVIALALLEYELGNGTEFEAQNTMNRAQVYKSAVKGMLTRHSMSGKADGVEFKHLMEFMQDLALRLHTTKGNQFRTFGGALSYPATSGSGFGICTPRSVPLDDRRSSS